MVEIVRVCPECEKVTKISVSDEAYQRYENGATALEAFPDITIDDRTTIVFGICHECIEKYGPYDE